MFRKWIDGGSGVGTQKLTVMRGLDPRIYPLRRHDGVWAPDRVGPRIKSADDGKESDGEEWGR
jgi:hypothetical protein